MKTGHCKIASPGFLVYYFFVSDISKNSSFPYQVILSCITCRDLLKALIGLWRLRTVSQLRSVTQKRNKVDNDIGGAVVARQKKKIYYENINAATTRFPQTSTASAVRDGHGSNQIGFLVFIFIYIYIYITHVHNRYICTLSRTYLHAFSFQTSTGLRSPRRAGCSEEKSSLVQKNKNTSAAARKAYKK